MRNRGLRASRTPASPHVKAPATWQEPAHSDASGTPRAEAASAAPVVLVRDTTDRAGFVLTLPAPAWAAFTATLK